MVPVRVLGVAVLLMALPLAGCLGGSDDQGPPPPAPPPAPTAEAYTGVSVADAKEHIHDYWANRTEVVLADTQIQTPAAPGREWMRSVLGGLFFRQQVAGGAVEFTLGNNTAVYEATGKLKIDVDATAALKGGQLKLWYHSAASPEWVGLDPQAAVATWDIKLTPDMADLPHSQSTRWAWRLEAVGTGALLDGSLHVAITASKGWEPSEWPAHPDFWQNRTHLMAAENWTGTFQAQEVFFFVGQRTGMEDLVLPDGKLIPHGTRAVEILLTWAFDGSPTNNAYDGLLLFFHPADSNGFFAPSPLERDATHARYVFAVEESMADSPYAGVSAWEFNLLLRSKASAAISGPAGFAPSLVQSSSGSWELDITAYDHDLPEAVALRQGDGDA